MATNIKAKKKKGTYDNKLIKWIAIGLGALVALIAIIAIVIFTSGNYVAKVNGKKIYTYEYKYFLMEAFNEEYNDNFEAYKPEGYDDMTEEEQSEIQKNFFTENKSKIEDAALEKAREFKAEYIIALSKGYKATRDQKNDLADYLETFASYYNTNASYIASMLSGGTMNLKQYKAFYSQQIAIENYKTAIKEGIEVTTDDIKAKYDEEPNDYRKMTARLFQFSLDQLPKAPVKPTAPKTDDNQVITEEMYNEGDLATKDKVAYEDYLKKLDEYDEAMEEYSANLATVTENYLKLANEMKDVFSADPDAKYTLYDYDMLTFEKKKATTGDNEEAAADGEDNGESGADEYAVKAEDATFADLCTSVSSYSSASTNKGIVTVNNNSKTNIEDLDELVLSVQWNDARDGFVFVDADGESSAGSSNDVLTTGAETTGTAEETKDPTPSEVKVVAVYDDDGRLTALYLVRVENIDDIDSDPAEDAEDGLNTIQSSIKSTILNDRADEKLEKEVEEGGSKYKISGKKEKNLAKINNEYWTNYGL